MATRKRERSDEENIALSDPLQYAMRRLQEAERTGARELDLSKLDLGPLLRGDWGGWEILGRLDKLKDLNLSENQITEIPSAGWEAIGRLARLSDLRLHENQMTEITAQGWESLGQLGWLSWLDLSGNGLTSIPKVGWDALGRMSELDHLYLQSNQIGDLPVEGWQKLGRLTKLSHLFLSRNRLVMVEEGWQALGRLTNLKGLSLGSIRKDFRYGVGGTRPAHQAGLPASCEKPNRRHSSGGLECTEWVGQSNLALRNSQSSRDHSGGRMGGT